jgi:hypothetical protein
VTNDGKKVYAGIAQAPGAVDVIDTVTLTNVKKIPVEGSVHNVYVTPDGKFAVSGSVQSSVITVIDTATDTVAWTFKETSGIRPMIFDTNPDGSTKRIFVQLSNYHGIAVVDWATHKETSRWELPDIPGMTKETEGFAGGSGARAGHYGGQESAAGHQQVVRDDVRLLTARFETYRQRTGRLSPRMAHADARRQEGLHRGGGRQPRVGGRYRFAERNGADPGRPGAEAERDS